MAKSDDLATALSHVREGRYEQAELVYRTLLIENSENGAVWHGFGLLRLQTGRAAEAVEMLERAISLDGERPEYLTHLGAAYDQSGRYQDALELLRKAVQLAPQTAQAHISLGMTLMGDLRSAVRDSARLEEAAEHFHRAIALRPGLVELHCNLATALRGLGRVEEANDQYRAALQINPAVPEAHLGHAVCQLTFGNLKAGFAEYEWRWKNSGYQERTCSQPRWTGESLSGRTILLYAEQGLGDTLQFVRFAVLAKQRGGRVILECQPPLVQLLSNVPFIDEVVPYGSPVDFDVHAPLLSLPAILALDEGAITIDEGPYLKAEARLVDAWRQRLAPRDGLSIGIAWQGDPMQLLDCQRSIPLAGFSPLAKVPRVRLISLQKGPGAEQLQSVAFDVQDLGSFDEAEGPFMDTSAVMMSLDLVITSDTSIAHLAGGLGVPVWVAVSANPDWRWGLKGEDSPWYPTMRLFRQARLGEWEPAFERIASELANSEDLLPRYHDSEGTQDH